ncbi:MAG TPA: response regulator transcription factor [Polyangiaceae bacterium]|nr:response regulator transcription factor [Polyangiaceae bacterium]
MTLRVLLADDHPVVRDGLKVLIESQADMCVVGEASDGAATLDAIPKVQPDLVVMDLSMPNLGGAEATERIRANHPEVKVLGLTAHEDRGYVQLLINAGAAGFVLKRAAADDLIRAIRAVAEGGMYIDPSVAAQILTLRRNSAPIPDGAVQVAQLSHRESEVLRLIAQGIAIKEVAASLNLSVRTIETYKARGMEKLSLKTRADLVRYALQRGWLKDF